MTLHWPDEPAWNALLTPIAPMVERAAGVLGMTGEWQVADLIDVHEPAPDPGLPEDLQPLVLDRWRRAAVHLLVAMIAGRGASWRAQAEAWDVIDHAAPALGAMLEGLATWWVNPERGIADQPERAAWLVRWARTKTIDPWGVTAEEWLEFGTWLLDRKGPASEAPVPVNVPAAQPGAWQAAPASLRRVRVEPGAAGARLHVDGALGPATHVLGEPVTHIYAALSAGPCVVSVSPIGPAGVWELRSGRSGQRFGAARGIELTLFPDGRGEVTLADGFVGPATEGGLELAAQFGVSGIVYGSWALVASEGDEQVVRLGEVRPAGITVHPRGRRAFAIPAGPMLGRAEGWMSRVAGTRWRIRAIEDGIEAIGEELGPTVVLRFTRAG